MFKKTSNKYPADLMKIKLSIILLFAATITGFSQQKPNFDKWNWLIGEWAGEGSGQPGQGGGTFSFTFDLDKNVLVRKSHSEYPETERNPKVIHDDLMVVYTDPSGASTKAIYFDNEGHTINYSVTFAEKSIVMTSAKEANMPVFRLTYTLLDPETVSTKFEMSQDGKSFTTYIEGASKRISQ